MIRLVLTMLALMLLAAPAANAQGDLLQRGQDLLRQGSPAATPAPSPAPTPAPAPARGSGLSEDEAGSGLREALRVGTERTVSRVGRSDGYYRDPAIRIPLPGFLETGRQGLAAVGAAGMLDDLVLRINRAAEAAAPQAGAIFGDAITAMTVSDARGIIAGPNDSVTQYFKRTTTNPLTRAFTPVVDRALADAGAVKAFNDVMARQAGGLGALGGGSTGFSLTGYVVEKAFDGIFHYIAQEEAAICTNPVARSTDLLRKVFGG
ncbi:MAG: DUF4197 domain-containing protein [Alphaproteobacteria bacterium]|nr:DUF4197 domain-containing protein [Alphaproteobacteria bacterium]